ncbi:MAG: hypothetical protein SOV63_00205 [Pyramidobacter porci]|nr:hypothetical protein [Pyramidobacter porci]
MMMLKNLPDFTAEVGILFRNSIGSADLKVKSNKWTLPFPWPSKDISTDILLISFSLEFFDDRCFFALSRAASFSSLKAISFFLLLHSPLC